MMIRRFEQLREDNIQKALFNFLDPNFRSQVMKS